MASPFEPPTLTTVEISDKSDDDDDLFASAMEVRSRSKRFIRNGKLLTCANTVVG